MGRTEGEAKRTGRTRHLALERNAHSKALTADLGNFVGSKAVLSRSPNIADEGSTELLGVDEGEEQMFEKTDDEAEQSCNRAPHDAAV
jgi:hypothetical protein